MNYPKAIPYSPTSSGVETQNEACLDPEEAKRKAEMDQKWLEYYIEKERRSKMGRGSRLNNVLSRLAEEESERVKTKTTAMYKTNNDEEWKKLNEEVTNSMDILNFYDRENLKETRKLTSLSLEETENTKEKRNNDTVDKEDNESQNEKKNSKKKRK